MKHIALLVSTLDSGGAEKQAVLLATQLCKKMSVELIVLYGDYTEYKRNIDLLANSTVRVHKLTGNLCSKTKAIKKILLECQTEVLLNYLTLPDFIGSYVGHSIGIRVYNGIRNSRLPKWKIWMERWAHNHWATGTIFNCYSGAEYFGQLGFDNSKNIVISNCYPDIEAPIEREEKTVKTIITVGRFHPQKDYEALIKAVSKIGRKDFRLCIVGYGELEEQIRGWVKEYGIEEITDIHIKPNNVPELEKNADIYLSTSLFEGTSNSIMEALNWSLPVVATNVGDNDHLVIDNENGFLTEIGDCNHLASAMADLLASPILRNKQGAMSNKNLRDNYSMEIFEERYTKLIEQ